MPEGLYQPLDSPPARQATSHDVASMRLEMRASLKDIWEVLQVLEREQTALQEKFDLLVSFLAPDV